MSDADLAKVKSWLKQQGFSIGSVSTSKNRITFSGTAAQAEAAFGAKLNYYSVDGTKVFAPSSELTIPAALSSVVRTVANLSSIRPKPRVTIQPKSVQANFTSSTSGYNYLTPKDVATIYNINEAYSAGYTGAGQSIAVVGQSYVYISDVENFQSAAGVTTKDPTLVLVPGTGSSAVSSGDEVESDLDLEYTSGIATDATIYFVYTGSSTNYGVFDAIVYAIEKDISPIISISYGACETALSSTEYTYYNEYFAQAATQGQSLIAAAGDSGSTDCYDFTNLTTTQRKALAVDFPASSQYVTGLGGTEFPAADLITSSGGTGANASTYWATSSSTPSTALSYIPEQVWNDDSSSGGISSGGGGTSTLTARPSWQTGVTGIPSGSYRLVPDISLASSPSYPGYLYCSSDSTSTGITGSCSNGFRDSTSSGYLTVAGGTSFASPIFAGMLAIINQQQNSTGQGVVNSTLYQMAAVSSLYPTTATTGYPFHDTTSGSNACTAGSTYCSSAGSSAYSTTTGYDRATGLGSVDLYQLMSWWSTYNSTSAAALVASTTTLSAATTTPTSGTGDTITITVASGSTSSTAAPTGTLTLLVDGSSVTAPTLTVGTTTSTAIYSFSSTTSGAHVIVAKYSGNSTYAASTGSAVVTIGSSTTTGTGSGGSGSTTVTVTPSGSYTGTVDFTLSSTSSDIQNYACYSISSATISSTTAVAETLNIYTGVANCTGTSIQSGKVHAFKSGTTTKISSNPMSPIIEAGFGSLGLLMAGLVGWRFRKFRGYLCVLALMVMGFGLSGCGGGSSSSSSSTKGFTMTVSSSSITVSAGTSGISKGSYTLTLVGTDSSSSSLTATKTLTLVVD